MSRGADLRARTRTVRGCRQRDFRARAGGRRGIRAHLRDGDWRVGVGRDALGRARDAAARARISLTRGARTRVPGPRRARGTSTTRVRRDVGRARGGVRARRGAAGRVGGGDGANRRRRREASPRLRIERRNARGETPRTRSRRRWHTCVQITPRRWWWRWRRCRGWWRTCRPSSETR